MPTYAEIGDRSVTIGDFTPFKFLEASEVVAEISREFPELLDEIGQFRADRAEKTALRLSRAAAEYQFPDMTKGISEAAWEHAGNELVMPGTTSDRLVGAAMFHRVFAVAREHVIELLAIALTPNSDFSQADHDGTYDRATTIGPARARILHEATMPQLVKLAIAVKQQLEDEYKASEEDLGNLLPFLVPTRPAKNGDRQRPKNGRASSSGSRKPSDGRGKTRSTARAGVS